MATVRSAWAKSLKAAVEFIKDSKEEFDKSITAAVLAEAGAQEMAKETLQRSAAPSEQPPAADAAAERTIKVLLVDDEEDFVRTMAERMEMRDLGSDVALDGEQALAMLEDEIPDVMVLDLRMPGIDGMEVLRRVRKAYPALQVIIMTGHGSAEEEKEARRLGAFEYLKKPVDINELMEVVRKAGRVRHENASGNVDETK